MFTVAVYLVLGVFAAMGFPIAIAGTAGYIYKETLNRCFGVILAAMAVRMIHSIL